MAQKRAHTKRTTSTEAAGNLTEREKGSFCFLITAVSYNARYAKLREVKKAHFPDFCRLSLGWLIFKLSSTVLRSLLFLSYFIVLFVSRLHILPVLCAAVSFCNSIGLAASLRLLCSTSCSCVCLSSCFLCGHGLVCFCQNLPRMLLYGWLLTAYNANYKDL